KPRIRREDVLARIGGEEFACLLSETGTDGAVAFAEDVRELVAQEPFICDGEPVAVTISLGVAIFEEEHPIVRTGGSPGIDPTRQAGPLREATELLRRADEKLYEAKRGGRNRVCV